MRLDWDDGAGDVKMATPANGESVYHRQWCRSDRRASPDRTGQPNDAESAFEELHVQSRIIEIWMAQ